jgi:hypothetical protein
VLIWVYDIMCIETPNRKYSAEGGYELKDISREYEPEAEGLVLEMVKIKGGKQE